MAETRHFVVGHLPSTCVHMSRGAARAILIVTHRDSSSPIIFISTEFYYDNYIKAAKIKRKRIFAYFFFLSLLVRCKGWFVLLFVQANRERYSWDICIAKRYMFVQYYNELRHLGQFWRRLFWLELSKHVWKEKIVFIFDIDGFNKDIKKLLNKVECILYIKM